MGEIEVYFFLSTKALYRDVGVVKRRRHCKYGSIDMTADLESCLSQGWDQTGPFELFTPGVLSWRANSTDG